MEHGQPLFRMLPIEGGWPAVHEVAWRVEVWFEFVARQLGAGIFEGDDPGSGRWASAEARERYGGPHGVVQPANDVAGPRRGKRAALPRQAVAAQVEPAFRGAAAAHRRLAWERSAPELGP
jgi:hypothetical protein